MLKEKIIYRDELPINVITANIEEYPIHFHDDMEVVYVLDGSITLRNGYYTYNLKQGDVYILNDREMPRLMIPGAWRLQPGLKDRAQNILRHLFLPV